MADHVLKPSERRAKAERIRKALEANPDATLDELRRLARSGQGLVLHVRNRWRVERGLSFSEAPA